MSDDLKLFLAEKVIEKQKSEIAAYKVLLTRHNALVEATIAALKFYAEEDAESVEDGILKSVFDRPATKTLAALVGEE